MPRDDHRLKGVRDGRREQREPKEPRNQMHDDLVPMFGKVTKN
jgi:hypothetical protein